MESIFVIIAILFLVTMGIMAFFMPLYVYRCQRDIKKQLVIQEQLLITSREIMLAVNDISIDTTVKNMD